MQDEPLIHGTYRDSVSNCSQLRQVYAMKWEPE